MENILSAIFTSDQRYFMNHISHRNHSLEFPARKLVSGEEFIYGTMGDSLLVSGGTDEERSALLIGYIRRVQGCVLVLHNGNCYLSADNLRKYGITAATTVCCSIISESQTW